MTGPTTAAATKPNGLRCNDTAVKKIRNIARSACFLASRAWKGETEKRGSLGGESSAARNGEKRVGATSLSLSLDLLFPPSLLALSGVYTPLLSIRTGGLPPPTTTPPPAQPLSLAARPHRRGGRVVVVVVVVRKVAQNESDLAGTARDRRLRAKTQTHYPLRCSVVTQWIF